MNFLSNPSVALIGYGGWGKNIARTLGGLGALKTVVDTIHAPGHKVDDLDAHFGDFQAVLEDKDIRAVAIATPTPSHFNLAKKALSAGKHVFLEKPFVETFEQVTQLEAVQGDRVLMVGHLMIYHNAFLKMREMCASGQIGKILKIETCRKNFGKVHAHEGVLWDIGPHDFSMVFHLMGRKPHKIMARPFSHIHTPHGDTETILMDFGEALGETQLSRIHPEKEQKVTVVGEKGTLVLDDTQPWATKLMHYAHTVNGETSVATQSAPQAVALEEKSPLTAEMEHFLSCVEKGTAPRTPASEARAVLEMIDAAERAHQKGKFINLAEV